MPIQTKNQITVIDSIMGSGKTSWAIEFINAHPDRKFIFCTPFLSEVERVRNSTLQAFYEPQHRNGGRKIDDFNQLLKDGRCIATTHATFTNMNSESLEYIRQGEYTLILDETIDVLIPFNDACNDSINKGDIRMLLKEGFIQTDPYGQVHWMKDSYPDSKFGNVERLARGGHLFLLDQSALIWRFPPDVFSVFTECYLLTYLFEGTPFKPYCEYHGIEYTLAGIQKDDNGYHLTEWKDDAHVRRSFREFIDIWDNPTANDFLKSKLSQSWYKQNGTESFPRLKRHMKNFFQNVCRAKSKDILWTSPKAYQNKLRGSGYIIVRALSAAEKLLPPNEQEAIEKKLQCFLSSNARASNDYADRSVLAYMLNVYPNPYVKRFFENKNKADNTDIHINSDAYALGCMLQWIWRSCIRKSPPEHIQLYLPSMRMRNLLNNWLAGNPV